jgi:hypothetical protein
MKRMLTGFIGGAVLLTSAFVNAEGFGDEDDTYIKFQIKVPLGAKRLSLFSDRNEYSAILIRQVDGIENGLVFTQDTRGNQTMGYVLSDFTLPLVVRDRNGVDQLKMNGDAASAASAVLGVVAGAVVIIAVAKKTAEEVTEAVVETALEVIDNHNNNNN